MFERIANAILGRLMTSVVHKNNFHKNQLFEETVIKRKKEEDNLEPTTPLPSCRSFTITGKSEYDVLIETDFYL